MSDDIFYLRDPNAVAIGQQNCFVFVRPNGSVTAVRPENTEIISKILAALADPLRMAELAAWCETQREEVESAMRILLREQIVLSGSKEILLATLPSPASAEEKPCKRLVFGITGAVHALLVAPLVAHLRRVFAQHIDVILTDAAQKFVKAEAFSYLGLEVWVEPFSVRGEIKVPHMHLASQADLVAIIPASANTIHRLATGECSDLLSLVVAATDGPVVVAPAMNPTMRRSAAIQRNIAQLRTDGIFVVEPGWSFEASKQQGERLSLSGIGVREENILAAFKTVMAAHRGEQCKRSGLPPAPTP